MKSDHAWNATRAGAFVGGLLASAMLAGFGAGLGEMLRGTLMAAAEGAGLMLFVVALLAAPVYAQTARRHDPLDDDAPSAAERPRRW
jgi:hypothetical protein